MSEKNLKAKETVTLKEEMMESDLGVGIQPFLCKERFDLKKQLL